MPGLLAKNAMRNADTVCEWASMISLDSPMRERKREREQVQYLIVFYSIRKKEKEEEEKKQLL